MCDGCSKGPAVHTVERLHFAVLKFRCLFSRSISLNNFRGLGSSSAKNKILRT